MNRSATSVWQGWIQQGEGTITTQSGALNETPFAVGSRIADENGTSPEELLAAAHAGCFNMALAKVLSDARWQPVRLRTHARVRFDLGNEGIRVSKVGLDVEATIPNIKREEFFELAAKASQICTISSLIKVQTDLNVTLIN